MRTILIIRWGWVCVAAHKTATLYVHERISAIENDYYLQEWIRSEHVVAIENQLQ